MTHIPDDACPLCGGSSVYEIHPGDHGATGQGQWDRVGEYCNDCGAEWPMPRRDFDAQPFRADALDFGDALERERAGAIFDELHPDHWPRSFESPPPPRARVARAPAKQARLFEEISS